MCFTGLESEADSLIHGVNGKSRKFAHKLEDFKYIVGPCL